MPKSNTILVTGGAGFIGSHLCGHLLTEGRRVICFDNLDDFYSADIKRRNVAPLLSNTSFKFVEGDVRNVKELLAILGPEGVDCVVHLAARAGVRPSIANPLLYADVNVNGTVGVLEAMRLAGIKKILFASSSSVYGKNAVAPFREDALLDSPLSPYAASKIAAELMCHTYHHLHGFDVASLRLFTVYGPAQRPDLAIHSFTRKIHSGHPIDVYGDGQSSRDYTYVADIVECMSTLADRSVGYETYNLGNSHPITLLTLIGLIEAKLERKAILHHMDSQPGDMLHTCADISKARRDIGYTPRVSIESGLTRFVEWYLSVPGNN